MIQKHVGFFVAGGRLLFSLQRALHGTYCSDILCIEVGSAMDIDKRLDEYLWRRRSTLLLLLVQMSFAEDGSYLLAHCQTSGRALRRT